MNQTKKRLSIINLAISMTDMETIQLQILKLGHLRSDEKIQEIIETLYEENYAQAQSLITAYIETPNNVILQRTFERERELELEKKRKEKEEKKQAEAEAARSDEELMDAFDLFTATPSKEKEPVVLNLEDMLKLDSSSKIKESQEEETEEKEKNDFIDVDTGATKNNDFWEMPKESDDTQETPKEDPFFEEVFELDTEENPEKENNEKREKENETSDEDTVEEVSEEEKYLEEESLEEQEHEERETEEKENGDVSPATITYASMPYIRQKFKNMQTQYPGIAPMDEHFTSVEKWIQQIEQKGCTEEEIDTMIDWIDSLHEDQKSEAAQLLLVSVATESKYAQFRLARALYSGEILQKNSPEAFTIINRLAVNEDYPEAICDLAQFYEHGIGISKDKRKALSLYKEAMDAGIKRAAPHYERLSGSKKGLFGKLFKN